MSDACRNVRDRAISTTPPARAPRRTAPWHVADVARGCPLDVHFLQHAVLDHADLVSRDVDQVSSLIQIDDLLRSRLSMNHFASPHRAKPA